MLYHNPDNRWPIFGCNDYDTFLERYLVKGLFHAKVPEDIIKEYETVEYLMAHAWYHYPMYDEAMSKFLRAFEIAVKLKCDSLAISKDIITKSGKKNKKKLVDLIKEIDALEPGKQQSIFLHHIREIRNIFMHPDHNSYVGGMLYNKIVFTINIINILFADEHYFVALRQRKEDIKKLILPFRQKILGFSTGEIGANSTVKNTLLHDITLGDVFISKGEELVLLFLDPVVKLSEKHREEKRFPVSDFLELKNLNVQNGTLYATDINTNGEISISEVTNDLLLKTGTDFRNYLLGLTIHLHNPYISNRFHEHAKEMQYFRYRHYHTLY